MAISYTAGKYKAWADNGTPLATGRLYTYDLGTTTHKNAFTDSSLTTPCSYTSDGSGGLYIAMNARGEAELWLDGTGYTLTLKTAAGATIESVDRPADSVAGTLSIAGGGTGATTAAGARTNLGSTAVGDALFIAATAAAARTALGIVGTAQVVRSYSGAVATGATTIPLDDTIPQNTEGDQYLTCAITPVSATSLLEIDVSINLVNSASGTLIAALFQDSTANAIASSVDRNDSTNTPICITFKFFMISGATSATTFKVRAGAIAAGTTTVNGATSARLLGGVLYSGISITEHLV